MGRTTVTGHGTNVCRSMEMDSRSDTGHGSSRSRERYTEEERAPRRKKGLRRVSQRRRRRRGATAPVRCWAAPLLAALALGRPATAQTHDYPNLSEDEELRLAMSAGPLAVSRFADVYRMSDRGFVRAIDGTNGWACIVVRSAADKGLLAPHCLNPYAVETVLPAFLVEGRLQAQGMEAGAIDVELERQWSTGELLLPDGPAYAYMLSEGQRIGPNGGNFRPHFMLYVPYVTNEDIGEDPRRMEFPFVGPYENHPLSTVVILMEEFVSPDSVVLPDR